MTEHELQLKVVLRPQGQPLVRVQLADQCRQQQIRQVTEFEFAVQAQQSVTLKIELLEKSDLDAATAVNIERIEIFGISDPRFVWAGQYCPTYPEPWATQQREAGHELLPVLTNQTYLGWRGTWQLTIALPAFAWIHQQQNLGVVYR